MEKRFFIMMTNGVIAVFRDNLMQMDIYMT